MDEQILGFTIKVVAERTGVSMHTLRAWERRYGVPKPNRGAENRYRLYDEQDIVDVLWMKQQVESGIPPAQASAMLRQRQSHPRSFALSEPAQPTVAVQSALLAAFIKSDDAMARQILDEAFALFAPEQVALQIIEPTMKEIGERWMRNEMTVWQEHLASNIVRQKILAVLQSQQASPLSVPYVIAACAPAEEHELGLLLFTLLARRRGWRVTYLGQGTPLADIVNLARTTHPNVIAVSIATVIGLAGLMPCLVAKNRPTAVLVFGGRLVNLLPSLREHLPGAFVGEDVLTGLRNLATAELCNDYWTPSRRLWNAVDSLRAQRLKVVGETVAQFMAPLPLSLQRKLNASAVNDATLFLVDTLACALAFDVPDLMDLQGAWLKEAMLPHLVKYELIGKHIEILAHVLDKMLSHDQSRLFKPLLERMKSHIEQ